MKAHFTNIGRQASASAALLHVHNLRIHFKRGLFRKETVRALDGVSLVIAKGETFGLVGESGCGKSSLARCLMRLIEPTSGEVLYDGVDVFSSRVNPRGLSKKIQLVFQDADGALNPRLRVIDLVLEPLKVHGLIEGNGREQAAGLFNMVNLPPDIARRRPRELSGGQRQRIGIARAISLSPELIIADEAAASLDILTQAQIVNLLKQLQAKLGMSYLFISHDLKLVRRIADRMAVMYLGKIVETGPTEDIFRHPAHPYTQALISLVPTGGLIGDGSTPVLLKGEMPSPLGKPSGCAFVTRCPKARAACEAAEPALQTIDGHHMVACHLAP